jgi:uncharacterized membrane protein
VADPLRDLEELRRQVAFLTQRVFRLEQAAGLETPDMPPATTTAVPPRPQPPAAEIPQTPATTTPATPQIPRRPPAPAEPERDLESQIGSHWLNRVGIVALLMGAAYFLKYAFENQWIGPAGRVMIGLLAGGGVIVWSERFRGRGYDAFALSLKAVGVGTLYLSLWAAFQLYQLVPGSVAFFAMVLVTAFTGFLAIRQDARLLAVFALLGGFSTPVLLSTGLNRQVELFSYVALLDVATLVLVTYRPWRELLFVSYAGTQVLFAGWAKDYYTQEQWVSTLLFLTLFFVIFGVVPLLRLADEGTPVSRMLILLPLVNALLYFLSAYGVLHDVKPKAAAWLAVAVAAAYLLMSGRLRANADDASRRLLYLVHVALAVGFLTVAIPIQLDTHWITIGWLAEAGVLLWVSLRARSDFLQGLAIAALTLGILRLLLFDNFHPEMLLLNARVATYAVAIGVLAAMVAWTRRDEATFATQLAPVAVVAINLLALTMLTHEVRDAFARGVVRGSDWRNLSIARDFTYSALFMAYGAGLLVVGFLKRTAFLRWQALILIAVTIVKVFIYDVSQLDRGYRILSFMILGALLLAISYAYQRDWLQLSGKARREGAGPAS